MLFFILLTRIGIAELTKDEITMNVTPSIRSVWLYRCSKIRIRIGSRSQVILHSVRTLTSERIICVIHNLHRENLLSILVLRVCSTKENNTSSSRNNVHFLQLHSHRLINIVNNELVHNKSLYAIGNNLVESRMTICSEELVSPLCTFSISCTIAHKLIETILGSSCFIIMLHKPLLKQFIITCSCII